MKLSKTKPSAKEEATNLLIDIFRNHIGIKNAINSEELFFKVTKIHPEDVDYYERAYKWNSIKRILSVLRKEGTLFVVMGTTYHYVLDSEEELENYKGRVDATIEGLHNIKNKAKKWITSKELKKLKRKSLQKKKERKALKVIASR